MSIVFGTGIFFSIPGSFTSGHDDSGHGSILQKLGRIDYLGAFTLVSHHPSYPHLLHD